MLAIRLGYALLALFLAAVSACRLDAECYRDDLCPPAQTCLNRVCVSRDAGPSLDDGGPDAEVADADSSDIERPDASDAGDATDAGTDGGCPVVTLDGGPLSNLQSPVGDFMLFHFDEAAAPTTEAFETSGRTDSFATCVSPGPCPPNGACGVFGRSVSFEGDGSLIMSSPALGYTVRPASAYTIEAWIALEPTRTSTGCILQLNDGIERTEMSFCVRPDGHLMLETDPPSVSTAPVPAGEWHHVAVVRDELAVTFFIDGESLGARAYGGRPISGGDSYRIGGDFGGRGWLFEGRMDELRVADRALTPDPDFSVSRPESYVAFSRGEEIVVTKERGEDAVVVASGHHPRWQPDASRIMFTHCDPQGSDQCDLWEWLRVEGRQMPVYTFTSNHAARDVPGTFSVDGRFFFFVRGNGCPQEIWRLSLGNGTVASVRAENERVLALDSVNVGAPGLEEEWLLFAHESCAGTQSAISALVEPSNARAFQPVFAATDAHRYLWVRSIRDVVNPPLVFERGFPNGTIETVYGDVQGAEIYSLGDTVRHTTFAWLRPEWYYFAEPSPAIGDGVELFLYDYAANALVQLTSGTSTQTPIRSPDFVRR